MLTNTTVAVRMAIVGQRRRLVDVYTTSGEIVYNIPVACKLFRVNVDTKDQEKDLSNLNAFLAGKHIVSVSQEYVAGKVDRWEVFVLFYDLESRGDGVSKDEKSSTTDSNKTKGIPWREEFEPTAGSTELKNALIAWRRERAVDEGVPLYRVLSNSAIDRIVDNMPDQVAKLHLIKGIGLKTQERYGSEIISMVRRHRENT
jgi:superfamily II DNA helicase RecQ